MSNFVSYAGVSLPSVGKKGILKQLDNGYYEIILGAFGAFGNGGWLYDEATAIQYMRTNPEFLKLIAEKQLRSEWGHPVRTPGMTDAAWFERVCTILETNWSSHIRKVHLSADTVKDAKGRSVIAVIGEVTPCGPHSAAFQRSLENPDEDVNYSIRSFAKRNFNTGRKHISKIITWDSVWTPGIKEASKFNTPSMESGLNVANALDAVEDSLYTEFHLDNIRSSIGLDNSGISMESQQGLVKILNSLTTTKAPKQISAAYRY